MATVVCVKQKLKKQAHKKSLVKQYGTKKPQWQPLLMIAKKQQQMIF